MLTERSGHTIGLILANASSSFTTAFMDFIEQALYQKGYQLVIGLTNHDIELERFYLDFFGRTTDGILILSDSSDYAELADAVPESIPAVFIHRCPNNCKRTAIIENDYSATFQAMLNLIHSGYPKVALICRNIKFSTSREIIQAYREAMNTTKEGFHENWIFECNTTKEHEVERLMTQITEKGFNGILAASVELTEHLAPYIYEYNTQHEEPISLTGFCAEDRTPALFESLDVICRPVKCTAELALQQLFQLMERPELPISRYLVQGSLHTRNRDDFQTL